MAGVDYPGQRKTERNEGKKRKVSKFFHLTSDTLGHPASDTTATKRLFVYSLVAVFLWVVVCHLFVILFELLLCFAYSWATQVRRYCSLGRPLALPLAAAEKDNRTRYQVTEEVAVVVVLVVAIVRRGSRRAASFKSAFDLVWFQLLAKWHTNRLVSSRVRPISICRWLIAASECDYSGQKNKRRRKISGKKPIQWLK